MNKSFEKLKGLIVSQANPFRVIVLTWLVDKKALKSSSFHNLNYSSIHQVRKRSGKAAGVVVFIHNSLNYKVRHDLSKSNDIIKTLSIELINQKKKALLSQLCAVTSVT